ncbi:thioredoxin family protein [Streptomyces sp. G44]|uniref:thioredoxin family protein n=1 Tax=Streptomyces sp. G44 TaxID=2807632 RepID=UPI0034D5B48C
MTAVTDDSFETEVLHSGGPVLLAFGAEWSGPSKSLAPLLDEVARDYAARLTVAKLDIDANPATPAKYSVRGVPTLILFKNGVAAQTKTGALTKAQITALVDHHI